MCALPGQVHCFVAACMHVSTFVEAGAIWTAACPTDCRYFGDPPGSMTSNLSTSASSLSTNFVRHRHFLLQSSSLLCGLDHLLLSEGLLDLLVPRKPVLCGQKLCFQLCQNVSLVGNKKSMSIARSMQTPMKKSKAPQVPCVSDNGTSVANQSC